MDSVSLLDRPYWGGFEKFGCNQLGANKYNCVLGHSIISGQRTDARMRLIPLNYTMEENMDLDEREEQDVGENEVMY